MRVRLGPSATSGPNLSKNSHECPDRFCGRSPTQPVPCHHTGLLGPGPVAPQAGTLRRDELIESGFGQIEKGCELGTRKGPGLAGPLDLDEPAAAEPDDVQVDLGGRVLEVVQVEHRLARDDPRADGGDAVAEDRRASGSPNRRRRASATATKAAVMAAVRVPPSASRTSASTWIVQGPSARVSTTARRLRPISRWISVDRPSGPRDLRVGVLPGEHRVLGRQPADPLPFQERRHLVATAAP